MCGRPTVGIAERMAALERRVVRLEQENRQLRRAHYELAIANGTLAHAQSINSAYQRMLVSEERKTVLAAVLAAEE